jgi:hypothetical protein
MNQLAPVIASHAPALVAAVGERASYRFFEFYECLISTTFEGLQIGPLYPHPAPEAFCEPSELI